MVKVDKGSVYVIGNYDHPERRNFKDTETMVI